METQKKTTNRSATAVKTSEPIGFMCVRKVNGKRMTVLVLRRLAVETTGDWTWISSYS
jgi:hypothetical protein